jgi:hypothetical protein
MRRDLFIWRIAIRAASSCILRAIVCSVLRYVVCFGVIFVQLKACHQGNQHIYNNSTEIKEIKEHGIQELNWLALCFLS